MPPTLVAGLLVCGTIRACRLVSLPHRQRSASPYLSTVEKGSGSRPGATFLHKIAQALGVTLADLVGREVLADSPDIPIELRDFASERALPRRDVEMLAGIAFRGEAPRTKQRWAFIYDAIKSSAAMDAGGS